MCLHASLIMHLSTEESCKNSRSSSCTLLAAVLFWLSPVTSINPPWCQLAQEGITTITPLQETHLARRNSVLHHLIPPLQVVAVPRSLDCFLCLRLFLLHQLLPRLHLLASRRLSRSSYSLTYVLVGDSISVIWYSFVTGSKIFTVRRPPINVDKCKTVSST